MRLRHTKSLIVVFTTSVLVAVAALLALDLWWRHQRALGTAETRASHLAVALSEYVRGAFTLAGTSLRQLAIHGTRVGGPAAAGTEWLPILSAARIALPGSGSVSVTDANGIKDEFLMTLSHELRTPLNAARPGFCKELGARMAAAAEHP